MLVVDDLHLANWLNSRDGQKNRNKPKPVSPYNQRSDTRTVRYGRTDATPEQAKAMLARYAPANKPANQPANE